MTDLNCNDTSWILDCTVHFNQQLEKCLPSTQRQDTRLHEAMHYAVLNGGKRLRPLLVYAAGLSFGATLETLDRAAIAIELIHCYSLVHDDLPAMDDDDLRRGKPSCHKAFDEATAILVGDALQALAFEILSKSQHPNVLPAITLLAKAAGAAGMVGGQVLDLVSAGQFLSLDNLLLLHKLKTAALFEACLQMGALFANTTSQETLLQLKQFGTALGLCFQIQDDILDVERSSAELGKTAGKDEAQLKATYATLLGLPEAKKALRLHYDNCNQILTNLDALVTHHALKDILNKCVFRAC